MIKLVAQHTISSQKIAELLFHQKTSPHFE